MKTKSFILGLAGVLLITLGLILLSAPLLHAQNNEFKIPLSDPNKKGKIKVHINAGSITIKGTARKDVLVRYVEADKDEEDEHEKSKDGLRRVGGGGLDLEFSESNNTVKIESGSWNNRLDLEIEVPTAVDMDVHTYNDGDLMISNIQGSLELDDYNGSITALSISGSVIATSYNGEIKVTFDKVTEGAPMSYSTFNGDIDVTFPAAIKNSVKVKTERGSIYSGFDVEFKSSGPVQKKDAQAGVYKVSVDEWRRGEINGGGAEVVMKTYNGDIFIRRK
jgi:DUF4097 and DUF4098 domain-containing protein YvlB